MESNNTIELSRADLHLSIDEIFEGVMQREGRAGLPRASYKDAHDHFDLRLEKSNAGYSISCWLNNSCAYQINRRFFSGRTKIGDVMLLAASATNTSIDKFFV